nr:response regulator transcription factor [Bifidobacterium callimiconis]
MADDTSTPYALADPEKLLQPSVLFIEDDPRIGAITSEILGEHYRVDWVTTGAEGRSRLFGMTYDAAIVDRRLPDADGLELVREARGSGITTPVLMLTALGSVDNIVEGLDYGANDYLTKPFHFEELEARLRALLRGYRAEQKSYDIGDWRLLPQSGMIESPDMRRVALTRAECTLLTTLCSSPQHVFSRAELLRLVFSESDTEGTIDTYVSYIRQKTTRHIIDTVRGHGYIIGEPRD